MKAKNEDNIKLILGKNVKYYRFLNKLTQEKLAEKCELSPRYISDLENGNGNISIDTLFKLSLALKINAYELIKKHNTKPLPNRVNRKI